MSLLDKASLVVTPNAYKESKLYSVIPNTTLGDMDVTRATTATRINSAGLVEVMPRNLLTYSEQIDNADWVKSNTPTITTNIAVAPNGTMTADGIQSPSGTNYKVIYQTKTISPNSTLTYSLYVKKETIETNFGGIGMYLSGGSIKSFYVIINAVTGTLVLTANSITPTLQVVDAGAYWRIIATVIDNGNNTSVIAEYYATISTNGTTLSPASGSVRTLWGFQLETSSTATEYFPTTTRLNIPRIDYTNGSCPSLLVEPQRTNLILYSEQFDNADWSKLNATITANTTTSPSGVSNADTLVITSGGYLLKLLTSFSAVSGQSITASIFVKNQTTNFLGFGGATIAGTDVYSIENYGNGWYRHKVTRTFTVTVVGLIQYIIFDKVGTHFIWGAQLEVGAYATSYIPTVASSVTRNADVISKSGISSLIGQTEGTIFLDFNVNNLSSQTADPVIFSTSGTNYIRLFTTRVISYFESNTVSISSASNVIINGRNKIAANYKNNEFSLYVNGVLVGSNNSGSVVAKSNFALNYIPTSVFDPSLFYNSIQLYKTKLTNAECIALTTL